MDPVVNDIGELPQPGRPYVPPDLRERVTIRTARDGAARAPILAEASVFVPALTGLPQEAPLAVPSAPALQPFVDPDPFQEFAYPTRVAAKLAI